MIRPTRGEIIPRNTSHNPTLCSDIGNISKVGKEEGPAEGRESPNIKKNQKTDTKTSKTEKLKKSEYYKAHKAMHAMYSDSAASDIYDLIGDDAIDLNQFACMCDQYCHFYSDISAAAVSSSKFTENTNLHEIH